jgi:hypothetical protein
MKNLSTNLITLPIVLLIMLGLECRNPRARSSAFACLQK